MGYLSRIVPAFLSTLSLLVLVLASACGGTPQPAPANQPVVVETQANPPQTASTDVVVYASDLPASALSEWEVWEDPSSPGGKYVGVANTGEELDPPPENDPHITFEVTVQSGVPYRCWIHMKVGPPEGVSQANKIWVQFSGSVDQANQEVLKPDTESYLTAEGPTQEGWVWVSCDLDGEESMVYFGSDGQSTVRLQAGMEGVGFDQFVLSPARYLENPPAEAIVEK
jgi:hypothetical protein